MGNILKEAIENEMREEITEDLRRMREWQGMGGAAYTDRDRVTLAKNHVLLAIEELEKTDVYNNVRGIIGILENAEDALADILKDYELETLKEQGRGVEPTKPDGRANVTWNGLDARGMARVLDYVWEADALDNDMWDELMEENGSSYRVTRHGVFVELAPASADEPKE